MRERCWRQPGQKLNISGIESEDSTRYSDKNYVRCKVCGFWCKVDKQSSCPSCGTFNYDKRNTNK